MPLLDDSSHRVALGKGEIMTDVHEVYAVLLGRRYQEQLLQVMARALQRRAS